MISTDYFWFRECPICDGQGRLIIKKNIDSNKLFLCCDECMSCWEYSIKSKIVNASEADISNFHWEKYKLHKCSDTFI